MTLALVLAVGPEAGGPAQAQSVVNQNLFSADRKPPAPPQAAPSKRQSLDEVRKAKVLGIFSMSGDKAALVEAPGTVFDLGSSSAQPIKVWVREKEMIGEFVVDKIEPGRVVLRRGEESCVLEARVRDKRLGRVSRPAPPAP